METAMHAPPWAVICKALQTLKWVRTNRVDVLFAALPVTT